MSKKSYLPEMTRKEVKEAIENKASVLIPIATIEQHGDHLPLHTDIDNVTSITRRIAENLNPDIRVLAGAPIWFSPAPWDPKTMPYFMVKMRKDVYMNALNDILESYLRPGFKKIVVINGHGGGSEWWIREVIQRLNSEERKSLIWPDWNIPPDTQIVALDWPSFLGEFAQKGLKEIFKGRDDRDWHGGEIETALQLYLRPELVNISEAKPDPPTTKKAKFAPYCLSNWHRQFIITGYYKKGIKCEDPTFATRETGEKIFKLAVEKISEFVKEFVSE